MTHYEIIREQAVAVCSGRAPHTAKSSTTGKQADTYEIKKTILFQQAPVTGQ